MSYTALLNDVALLNDAVLPDDAVPLDVAALPDVVVLPGVAVLSDISSMNGIIRRAPPRHVRGERQPLCDNLGYESETCGRNV